MSSESWQPFCIGLNVLYVCVTYITVNVTMKTDIRLVGAHVWLSTIICLIRECELYIFCKWYCCISCQDEFQMHSLWCYFSVYVSSCFVDLESNYKIKLNSCKNIFTYVHRVLGYAMDIFHISALVACSTFQQNKKVLWSIHLLWPFQLECSSCTQGPIYWLIYVCYNLSIESVNMFNILMLRLYMILMILQPSDMFSK